MLTFDPPNGFTGSTFTYTPIDSNGTDAPTATFVLNVPPDTDGSEGIVNPGETIDLDNNGNNTGAATQSDSIIAGTDPNTGTDLVGGSNGDGTGDRVVFYEFDLATLPANGTLFVGNTDNPANGGTAVNGSNALSGGTTTRILAADIDKLYFVADTGFESAAIEYRAVDTYGAADRTPATILLKPTGGNLPPNTNPESGLIDADGKLPLNDASLADLGGTDPESAANLLTYKLTELPFEGKLYLNGDDSDPANLIEIGRASCRERV